MSAADDDMRECRESLWPLVPIVLTASSTLLLGYIFGRTSYRKDVVQAIRTVEKSPVPVEVVIKDAF